MTNEDIHSLTAIGDAVREYLHNPTPRQKVILKSVLEKHVRDPNLEPTGPGESEKCVTLSGGGVGRPHEYDIPVEWEEEDMVGVSLDDSGGRGTSRPYIRKIVTKLMCLCGSERKRKI